MSTINTSYSNKELETQSTVQNDDDNQITSNAQPLLPVDGFPSATDNNQNNTKILPKNINIQINRIKHTLPRYSTKRDLGKTFFDNPKSRMNLYPFQRLNLRDYKLPFEDDLKQLKSECVLTPVMIYEYRLFDSIIHLHSIGINDFFGGARIVTFRRFYDGFLRQKCRKTNMFTKKLYAVLKICSYCPDLYPLLGAIWVSDFYFKVNSTTFGMALNTVGGRTNSAIFNNCGLFNKHGFVEVLKKEVVDTIEPEKLEDVNDLNVRIITDPEHKFGKDSLIDELFSERFNFRKKV